MFSARQLALLILVVSATLVPCVEQAFPDQHAPSMNSTISPVGGKKLKITGDGKLMSPLRVNFTVTRKDINSTVLAVLVIMALNRTDVTTGRSQIIAGCDAIAVLTLAARTHTEEFLWNETAFGGTLERGNYTISGVVNVISSFAYNINPADNIVFAEGGPVEVTVFIGDLDYNGVVDFLDLSIVVSELGILDPWRWQRRADVSGDGVVNITDVAIVAKDFGKDLSDP